MSCPGDRIPIYVAAVEMSVENMRPDDRKNPNKLEHHILRRAAFHIVSLDGAGDGWKSCVCEC